MTATEADILWAGRITSALAILFLLFDSVIKVLNLYTGAQSGEEGHPWQPVCGVAAHGERAQR